jgi:hypothetical protein
MGQAAFQFRFLDGGDFLVGQVIDAELPSVSLF